MLGCLGIVLVVFFVGFCGLLAAWGGQITDTMDFNLYFFAVSLGPPACLPGPAWACLGLPGSA